MHTGASRLRQDRPGGSPALNYLSAPEALGKARRAQVRSVMPVCHETDPCFHGPRPPEPRRSTGAVVLIGPPGLGRLSRSQRVATLYNNFPETMPEIFADGGRLSSPIHIFFQTRDHNPKACSRNHVKDRRTTWRDCPQSSKAGTGLRVRCQAEEKFACHPLTPSPCHPSTAGTPPAPASRASVSSRYTPSRGRCRRGR